MTGFLNKLKKVQKIKFYAGLLLVGLLFTVLSALIVTAPKTEKIATEATIDSIEVDPFANESDSGYYLVISFTDQNGVRHEGIEFNAYTTGMKEGDKVAIEYDSENPELVSTPGSDFIPYVFLVIGIVCVVASVYLGVKAVKTPSEELNQLDRTKKFAADPEKVEAVKNNDEPTYEYYFHYTGKLNQSYVMETPARNPVYRADCDKMALVGDSLYTFEDCATGKKTQKKVGHTTTERFGESTGIGGFSVPASSRFKIDGEDNWDVLGRLGYSLVPHISGIKLNFDLLRYSVKVGEIEAAGANILKDGATNPIGDKLPGVGLYKVRCKNSDIEGAFTACFCASKVEFF